MLSFIKNKFKKEKTKDEMLTSTDSISSKLSIESEVNFLKSLLEKKFNRKFQIRVKVSGYLDDMKYSLVMDDYCTNDPCYRYHSIYGYETKNILDIKSEFLKAYWDSVEKVHKSVGKQLDNWESEIVRDYKETMVVESREELLIKADLQGIV